MTSGGTKETRTHSLVFELFHFRHLSGEGQSFIACGKDIRRLHMPQLPRAMTDMISESNTVPGRESTKSQEHSNFLAVLSSTDKLTSGLIQQFPL